MPGCADSCSCPHGPHSDDTFRRIFTALDPKGFAQCFIPDDAAIRPDLAGSLIAIDRKTLCHSFDYGAQENSIHIISAWADDPGPEKVTPRKT